MSLDGSVSWARARAGGIESAAEAVAVAVARARRLAVEPLEEDDHRLVRPVQRVVAHRAARAQDPVVVALLGWLA